MCSVTVIVPVPVHLPFTGALSVTSETVAVSAGRETVNDVELPDWLNRAPSTCRCATA